MVLVNWHTPKGLIIAAPGSGSGKTLVVMGLIAALRAQGMKIAAAKTGPDYIDTAFLSLAAGTKALNLDPWAMEQNRLKSLATTHASKADLLLIEGVMGLFDGAANGQGSTADLAETLGLPVLLVVDAARQSQSIAALVSGFANWRKNVQVAGVILNNVASVRHEQILRGALRALDIPLVGVLHKNQNFVVPSRHLGLVLPSDIEGMDAFINSVGAHIASQLDLDLVQTLARPLPNQNYSQRLAPLGQHIAIARDKAFAFIYAHWLEGWRNAGAKLSFFSPLNDEAPNSDCDAVFLPGGYPELHGERLANAHKFSVGLKAARSRNALIYGECGGYMVLGQSLTDKQGKTHKMTGLLPHSSAIDQPRRVLGYRALRHASPLPWDTELAGHEFHYSSASAHSLPPLFEAQDATGNVLCAMGGKDRNVMGSYAHVIDMKSGETP